MLFWLMASEPSRPDDRREEDGGQDQGERKPEEADEGCADEGNLRPADVENAKHRGSDEQGGGNDGEDQPVCEDVHAAEQFIEASVLELHLELTVRELGKQQP